MADKNLAFNGIDGATGDYLLGGLDAEAVANLARGQPVTPEELKDARLRRSLDQRGQEHLGLKEGLDPKELSQAGWGVIFPSALEAKRLDELKEALKPLLDLRREQAARVDERFYREFSGPDGFRPGETKGDFLRRFGRGPGPADPEKIPYYLLIAGEPAGIPFSFQYQLDVQYAVGRIAFDTAEDYYRYACSVVQAETRKVGLPPRAVFWGTANEADPATNFSAEYLVEPLAGFLKEDQPGWKVETLLRDQAYKSNLNHLLHGPQAPALLFTASHGLGFPNGHPLQLSNGGALLCQDWPGPGRHIGPLPGDFYFSADDLDQDAEVSGLVAFFFACYGAGTPAADNFFRLSGDRPRPIAPRPFLARLPQRLLSHPKGGALAVAGHVERAWGYSFYWDGVGADLTMFASALKRLAEGHPIGSAFEYVNQRYAELAADLSSELDETLPEMQDEAKLAGLWTSNNDARNYAILGDPAVRLAVGEQEAGSETGIDEQRAIDLSPRPAAEALETAHSPEAAPDKDAPAFASAAAQLGQLRETLEGAALELDPALRELTDRLEALLSEALKGAEQMEIATHTAGRLDEAQAGEGSLTGGRLRLLTRLDRLGRVHTLLPEETAGLDPALWKAHLDMVHEAQAGRVELLRALSQVATDLADRLRNKPQNQS